MKLHTKIIQKTYKGRPVVKGVTIEVNQGEIVGLLGPNGAGKTTSFYMIVGLVKPDSGTVFLDDVDITNYPMYRRAQLGIGYLPQEVSVFRKLSVEDNILAILEMTELKKQERLERLEQLLEEFSLTHVRKNLGHSLSGGEKRRTEIARALATNPKFILLDEPFAGVDPFTELIGLDFIYRYNSTPSLVNKISCGLISFKKLICFSLFVINLKSS